MGKTIVIILFISSLLGCKKDSPIVTTLSPSQIDGLELKFIETKIQHIFTTIYFQDENTGFIAGNDGVMYKTYDGGNSWMSLNTNTSLPLYDIFFINKNEGFAVGGEDHCGGTGCIPKGAIIIYTKDGGQSWNPIPITLSEQIVLKSIYFTNDSFGFTVGDGLILSTEDRGATWNELKINNLGGVMMDVKFISAEKGFISCTFGKLLKTIDGGANWTISSPFNAIGANTLSFVNENLIFSAGYSKMVKSQDFGNTWVDLSNSPTDIFKLILISNNIGFAFGRGEYSGGDFGHSYGAIYFTTDGGSTWKGNNKIQELGLIQSASFPTTNVGFAISGNVIVRINRH